jgi:hypothetical protein
MRSSPPKRRKEEKDLPPLSFLNNLGLASKMRQLEYDICLKI